MRSFWSVAFTGLFISACTSIGVNTPIGTIYGRPGGSDGGQSGGSTTVVQSPEHAARAAAEVFRQRGIPVAEAAGTTVRSGLFRVERRWGNDRIEERVTCGDDASILLYSSVEIQVAAYAAPESVRPGGAGRDAQQRTTVTIESEGYTTDTRSRCYLTAGFTRELLSAIASAAGRPGRIVVGGPTR